MINGGIFGPKLSGKTTLAKSLSAEYWRQRQIVSYVLDPWRTDWGHHSWVVSDNEFFWRTVWEKQGGLVIVDDGSATIARDEELMPVFTMMRHNQHRLLVIGHNGANLLPAMRQELDTLFLFRQPIPSAKIWYENFSEPKIMEAPTLRQYEFLEIHSFGGCDKKVLTSARRGPIPSVNNQAQPLKA